MNIPLVADIVCGGDIIVYVCKVYDDIGITNEQFGAFYTFMFDFVFCFANSGGIDKVNGKAAKLYFFFYPLFLLYWKTLVSLSSLFC